MSRQIAQIWLARKSKNPLSWEYDNFTVRVGERWWSLREAAEFGGRDPLPHVPNAESRAESVRAALAAMRKARKFVLAAHAAEREVK